MECTPSIKSFAFSWAIHSCMHACMQEPESLEVLSGIYIVESLGYILVSTMQNVTSYIEREQRTSERPVRCACTCSCSWTVRENVKTCVVFGYSATLDLTAVRLRQTCQKFAQKNNENALAISRAFRGID